MRESPWTFRIGDADKEAITAHAQRRGKTVSEHIREVLIRAAKGEFKMEEIAQKPLF